MVAAHFSAREEPAIAPTAGDTGGDASKRALPCLAAASSSEEAETNRAVVAVLNPRWRIIECRDRIQWILQRRAGLRHGQPRWDGRCYCRTREG